MIHLALLKHNDASVLLNNDLDSKNGYIMLQINHLDNTFHCLIVNSLEKAKVSTLSNIN